MVMRRSTLRWRTVAPAAYASVLGLAPVGCGVFFDNGSGDAGVDDMETDPDPAPDVDPGPSESPFTGECVPADWGREDASDPPGVELELALSGYDLAVDGDSYPEVETITAPGTISNGGANLPLLAFDDALVDGATSGTLVVVSATVDYAAGTFVHTGEARVTIEGGVFVEPNASPDDDGVRPDLGPLADAGHADAVAASIRLELAPQDVQITNYELAYIITDDGSRIDLDGPFTVTAAATFRRNDTGIYVDSVTGRWDGPTVIGLTATSGEARVDGQPLAANPSVVLGFDPHLRVGPGKVETLEPMRARVAMDEFGALLDSGVQLRACEPQTLVMYPGQSRRLAMAYRQFGPSTDAVFSAVVARTPDGSEWPSRVEPSADIPSELHSTSEQHPNASWAQGFIDFVDAWTDLTKAIGRGTICVFTFGFVCPDGADGGNDGPPPLLAYPGWMTPYAVGEFELELTAPEIPGEYDVELTIEGDNYIASVPVHVIVPE
jgi:hypothetical protein